MSRGLAMRAPDERLIEGALALIVDSEIAPGEAAQQARLALHRWCGRSPEHAAAAQEARARWDALGGMADGLRARFDEPARPPLAPARAQRRKLLLSVAGLLGAGLAAGRGVQWYWQQPVFAAAYATRTAQTLRVMLADGLDGAPGSRLDLAPQSQLDVTLYRQRRMVAMARGEVRFEVAHDRERPFWIHTRAATIEVVGTAFTVRDRGGPVSIGVERGHVRVQLHAPPGAPAGASVIELRGGELLEIREGRAEPVRQADTAALAAWREGWLVFENTPLGEALATVNSYRAQPIVTADARVDAMRLSGRFRSNESAGLLAALPSILPLVAVPQTDGSVVLRPR